MLLPLGVALQNVLIDAGLALIALLVGFYSAIWYVKFSSTFSAGGRGDSDSKLAIEAKANEAARSSMAAQQMRDLAKNVASDVGDHCTLMSGISSELGEVDSDSPEANIAIAGAVDKILSANEKLQSRLAEAEQKIQVQAEEIKTQQFEARSDALTKLANRRAFDDALEQNLALCSRKQLPFSLLLLDVDHFKKLNDTHGHQAGDEVLRSVGKTLKQVVKSSDIACRYGGEEFALVMPSTPIDEARVAAERVRKAIESMVVEFEGKTLSITISLGLAEAHAGETAVKLIGRSDAAVYFSKEAGRNCGHWHDGEGLLPMDEQATPKVAPPATSERPPLDEKSEQSADTTPDRAAFTHELQRRVAECHRFGVTLASMSIVVKNYAGLEKEFGDAVGELLLNSVARFIRASLRDMDLVGKITPGEFAVMLPGSSGREASMVASRIQTAIASCAIPLGDKEVQLELIIGVSGVEPGDDAEKMIERARAETVETSDQIVPVA